MKIRKRSKWLSLFVIAAVLASMLLMQAGMASAATLQPIINPAGGTFTTAQTVTISNIANGDTAYYTIDGSSPINSSTHIVYNNVPITVSQSETVQAVAYDATTGWSTVTSATFTINGSSSFQAPVVSPDGGTFTTAQTVSIINASGNYYGGTIYYTTDGSNPVTSSTRIAYRWPFTVYQSETINAANYSSAGWSAVASAVFYINGSSSLQAPVISPDGGTFTTTQTVSISNTYGGAIYYTTDGSSPETSSTRIAYNSAFTVYQSETINAASDTSTGWSAVASAVFYINGSSSLQAPVISPDGGTFTTAQSVSISDIYGTAYYTTDGTSPETSSTRIAYNGAFTVYQSETINAANYSSAGWSAVTSAVFYLNGSTSLQAPVISPDGGSFTGSQTVTIGDTYGTTYYTTDGSNPEGSSTALTYSGPFTVSQSETINAVNYSSSGWSTVASAVFTINGSVINPITPGTDSAQIAQLEQELQTALSSGQMAQATQILQQIQQLEAQNTNETQLSTLEQQLITTINSSRRGKWAKVAAIMRQIAKIEASEASTAPTSTNSWTYSLLGQAFQQQGNNNINVFNSGNQINFDVQPIIVNGRTLIPIRQVANAFGISNNGINWNQNGTVTINNGSSQIQFNNNGQQAYLNGASYGLDVPAQIVNGRMMVPLRAIGQMFHRNVQWYPNGRIVAIQ